MEIITVLLIVAAFMSFYVLERQNVEIKATLKRIEEKIDTKKGTK